MTRRIAVLGSGSLAAVAAIALMTAARGMGEVVAQAEPRIKDDSRWNPQSRQSKEKAQWKRERAGRKS